MRFQFTQAQLQPKAEGHYAPRTSTEKGSLGVQLWISLDLPWKELAVMPVSSRLSHASMMHALVAALP